MWSRRRSVFVQLNLQSSLEPRDDHAGERLPACSPGGGKNSSESMLILGIGCLKAVGNQAKHSFAQPFWEGKVFDLRTVLPLFCSHVDSASACGSNALHPERA